MTQFFDYFVNWRWNFPDVRCLSWSAIHLWQKNSVDAGEAEVVQCRGRIKEDWEDFWRLCTGGGELQMSITHNLIWLMNLKNKFWPFCVRRTSFIVRRRVYRSISIAVSVYSCIYSYFYSWQFSVKTCMPNWFIMENLVLGNSFPLFSCFLFQITTKRWQDNNDKDNDNNNNNNSNDNKIDSINKVSEPVQIIPHASPSLDPFVVRHLFKHIGVGDRWIVSHSFL